MSSQHDDAQRLLRPISNLGTRPASELLCEQVAHVSAAGTIAEHIDLEIVNAAGGAVSRRLPTGTRRIIGKKFTVVKGEASVNAVTMLAPAGQTIDGLAGKSTSVNGDSISAVWDGVMWRQVQASAGAASEAAADAAAGAAARSIYQRIITAESAKAETGSFESYAGTITRISVVAVDAVAVGNLVVTFAINGVPITGGVVTLPAGTAANTPVAVTPSALNVVANNGVVSWAVSGGNTALGPASIRLELA
jgi:hypothetical protein